MVAHGGRPYAGINIGSSPAAPMGYLNEARTMRGLIGPDRWPETSIPRPGPRGSVALVTATFVIEEAPMPTTPPVHHSQLKVHTGPTRESSVYRGR